MKIFKKLLTIILIIAIIYMIYYIYSNFKKENITIDSLIFNGNSNSIIDINSTSNTTNVDLSSLYNTNNTVSTNHSSSSQNNFYYKQLDNNAKIIYNKLEENIPNLTKNNFKIDFSTQFNTLLNSSNGKQSLANSFQAAIDAFFYDHTELFYIDLTKMSLYTKSISFVTKTTYYVSIIPENNQNYLAAPFSTEAKAKQAIAQVESIRNSFKNKVSGDNYNKMLQVHDTLINMLEYDESYSRTNDHNIYGALIEKKVVCEGYAKAFKYILDSLNIPCILVSGTGTNSKGETESHMWNYVQLNDKWYGVDCTWDDPIIIGGGSKKSTINHDYFCKGSMTFNRSHTIKRAISNNGMKFSYPTLSTYDYR